MAGSTGGKAPRKFLATKATRRTCREANRESSSQQNIAKKTMEMAAEYLANLKSEIPKEVKDAIRGSKNSKLLYCFIMQLKIAHHS